MEGLRGETSIAALCRREGIPTNLYYRRSKDFLEAGKQRLVGDAERQADSRQVSEMRAELEQLKQLVAELSLKNHVLKGSLLGKEPLWDKRRLHRTPYGMLRDACCAVQCRCAALPSREAGAHQPGGTLRPADRAHPGGAGRAA